MRQIKLAETGHVLETLTLDEARALTESEIVTVTRNLGRQWRVKARGKVGVARVGDIELWIEPKLPISRLLFLVSYAQDRVVWSDDLAGLDKQQGLVPVVGEMLWRQTETALRHGFLQGYYPADDASYVMRGRLRENAQVRRHHGRVLPLEVRFDDFTTDIPENQILLAAVTRMLDVLGLSAESRRRLHALHNRLGAAASPVLTDTLPYWQPNRLNERYHAALRLAEAVWHATPPEYGRGSLAVNGFLFPMEKVFEDFVAAAFGEHLPGVGGGSTEAQYHCHLDAARTASMWLDLVWWRDGRIRAVIDAKYKQDKGSRNPQLYQMMAYCAALGVPRAHLIYAEGEATPRRYEIPGPGIAIVAHSLDLTQQPAQLLEQVRQICTEVVADTMGT